MRLMTRDQQSRANAACIDGYNYMRDDVIKQYAGTPIRSNPRPLTRVEVVVTDHDPNISLRFEHDLN